MYKKQTHLIYGLVAGVMIAAFSLILYQSGLIFKYGMRYTQYIPLLVCILLNAFAYSKVNNGYVSFMNIFSSCFKASLVACAIFLIWNVLTLFIFPGMKEKLIEHVREEMIQNPAMSDDAIETAISFTRKTWNFFLVAGTIVIVLFWGSIFSLLGGAMAKKKGEMLITEEIVN